MAGAGGRRKEEPSGSTYPLIENTKPCMSTTCSCLGVALNDPTMPHGAFMHPTMGLGSFTESTMAHGASKDPTRRHL